MTDRNVVACSFPCMTQPTNPSQRWCINWALRLPPAWKIMKNITVTEKNWCNKSVFNFLRKLPSFPIPAGLRRNCCQPAPAVQQSIGPLDPQQLTRHSGVWRPGGTEKQTDGRPTVIIIIIIIIKGIYIAQVRKGHKCAKLYRSCSAFYVASANNIMKSLTLCSRHST